MNTEKSEVELKELLRRWGQFPAADEADFNCLVREVMDALSHDVDEAELVLIIHNEFFSHFGKQGPHTEVKDVAEDIMTWWGADAS
ncbi:MAG: hypothetical protein ACKVRP_07505 [Bacteroidota bacterium]